MIIINCPYCDEEINIFWRNEITNLITKGISDRECDHCKRIFEIFQGKEKYETKVKVVN